MKCARACFLRLVVLVVALRVVSECSMDTFVSPFSMTQRCPARPPFSRRFLTRSLLHCRGPSWGSCWLPVCLLLLSGDVDPNPGPVLRQAQWKYPCGVCSRAMRSNQKGIFCEVCLQWLHTKSINLSNADYDRLSSSDEGWCCSPCLKEALPFHNCSERSKNQLFVDVRVWLERKVARVVTNACIEVCCRFSVGQVSF